MSKPTTKRASTVFLVPDKALRAKESQATRSIQQLCPGSQVRLYRTEDGRVMVNLSNLAVPAGKKNLLDQVYRVVMGAIDERRGRPPGVKKVQTKLNLPEPVYRRLRAMADDKSETMSDVVAELIGT